MHTYGFSSFPVANVEIFPFLQLGFFSVYCSAASFENTGSVTIKVSSSTNNSQPFLVLYFNTFQDHLSQTLPGSLDNSMQVMSGVFSTFQLCKWSIFSYLTKKFWNLLASASPALMRGHYYISLQFDAVMICGFTNLSVSLRLAVLNPGSEGSWMQYFAISLASPFVNLIKLVSCPLGSVSLFSTTSSQTSIK